MASAGSGNGASGFGCSVLPFVGPDAIRPLPGVAVQRGLFAEGVEEVQDRADAQVPEVASPPPSSPPPDTKAWRKSWRKKWRKGSTYRSLTCLQARLLQYVEDNSGDDGSVLVTLDQLADAVSSPREIIHRSSVAYGMKALVEKGLILTVQQSVQQSPRTISRYTRVNFREYQEPAKQSVQQSVQQSVLSSRGKQKKQKEDPELAALVDAMRQKYRDRAGEDLDIPDRTLGDLMAVRKIVKDDSEVLRRWETFLQDKFYPTKNLNRFRAAQSKYATKKTKPSRVAPSSLPESSRVLLEQMESYAGRTN